ncbi:MAG: hypothetical protein KBA75_01580 [Alphaproteobacteria bacterium]|nr:hypothetical protein [Alphaproteobacteria bacterium]
MRRYKFFTALLSTSFLLLAQSANAATLVNTQAFLDRFFGVNTHLNNCCNGKYENTARVISEIQYIGATHLRDGPIPMGGLIDRYKAIASATGVKFHAVIESGSPKRQRDCLAVIDNFLKSAPGLISLIEGGNEEDTTFPKSQGATLSDTATLQYQVNNIGQAAKVKVAQLSVGAGWAPPLWEGNYKKFGKPPADYGNAHVYSNKGEVPSTSLKRIGELAAWSVNGKAVDVSEYGIFSYAQATPALTSAYMHIAPFSSYLYGHAYLSVYALHDDSTGVIGFYNAQGVPRAHAHYWHATSRLLADPAGRNLPARTANITFTNLRTVGKGVAGIKNVPMFKSNGSVWIAVYDEEQPSAAPGAETITLDKTYPFVQVIDGRSGATLQTLSNARQVSINLPPNQLFFVVGTSQKVVVKL